MTAEEVETTAYTGYARLEVGSLNYTGPVLTYHCFLDASISDTFATFVAQKNIHSIGVYDALSGGNLLAWMPLGITGNTGDYLILTTLSMAFNGHTGTTHNRANSCRFMSQMIARWLSNSMGSASSVGGYVFSEINTISKDRRCMIVESESNTTGNYWKYPAGGTPVLGSSGSGYVKYASPVDDNAGDGVSVIDVPGVSGSSALCLSTRKASGAVRFMKADYGSAFTGSVTKVTYAMVVTNGGAPPPDHIDGYLSDSSLNEFVPLAEWTPDGSDWTFTSGTTKLVWTLGMSVQRTDEYVPNPTYGGSMTGLTVVDPLKLTLTEGYPYEHSLVSLNSSTLSYDLTSTYAIQEYDYADPADYSIPVSAYELDPVAELVDLRRYTVDARSGDTHVAFSVKLRTADGDIPSTTGKSVVVRYSIKGGDTAEVRGSVPANYSTTGRVIFALPAVALVSAGQVRAEIALEGPGDSVQTFPYDDTIFISIMRSL